MLIDYENVGPSLQHCRVPDDAQVIVFLGQTTAKIHPHLARLVGRRGEFVNMDGRGPNALDLHLAFYAGMIASTDRTSHITFISHDKGFDPLLNHMSRLGVSAMRLEPPRKLVAK